MNLDDGLRALMQRGYRFQPGSDDDGNVTVLVGSHGWPGFDDRIHIYGETDAIAARVVADTRPGADDVVWSYEGDAVATVQALLELPAPDTPGAPRLARRAPSGLWLPSRSGATT